MHACAVVVAAVLCCATLPAFSAPSPDEIRQAVEDVLSDPRFQGELPGGERPIVPESESRTRWRLDLPDGLTGLARLLMWVLVAAGGVLLAIFLINEVVSYRLRPRGVGRQVADATAVGGMPGAESDNGTSLAEADRLAAAGRHAEALHMLLLDCLTELRRRRFEAAIAPSLTSREVVGRLPLSERALAALSAIVSAVELSHFGGRAPGEDEYVACRHSYLRVAQESVRAA